MELERYLGTWYEVARLDLFDDLAWSPPAFADGLEDFLQATKQIQKMGPIEGLLKMIPGVKPKMLEGVDVDLIKVVKRAIELTEVDFGVTEGVRSEARQAALVKAGWTPCSSVAWYTSLNPSTTAL